jgi:hypothetical protein
MNKKYLLVFGSFLLIVSILFLLLHNSVKQGGRQNNAIPTSPTTTQLSPQDVTKSFYSWYVSYAGTPITSNDFKNSPYLTTAFKQQSIDLYDPTNIYDPVFCKQNQTAYYVFYETKPNPPFMDVIIHQDNLQGKSLYRVILARIKGQWQIIDIMCDG